MAAALTRGADSLYNPTDVSSRRHLAFLAENCTVPTYTDTERAGIVPKHTGGAGKSSLPFAAWCPTCGGFGEGVAVLLKLLTSVIGRWPCFVLTEHSCCH